MKQNYLISKIYLKEKDTLAMLMIRILNNIFQKQVKFTRRRLKLYVFKLDANF